MPFQINGQESRVFNSRIEIRQDGENPVLRGYAAVFNSLSEPIWGMFREKISPGAFKNTLSTADIRALWQHNPLYVLGRNKAGTLFLEEDARGLAVDCKPPDAQWAKDALESMKRGDVSQMSFGFKTIKDEWDESGPEVIRTLLEVELFEVSPVTFPAYPDTSIGVRSIPDSLEQLKATMPEAMFRRMVESQIENLRSIIPVEEEPEKKGNLLFLRHRLEIEALNM